METHGGASRKFGVLFTRAFASVGAAGILLFTSFPAWPETSIPPSITTIEGVEAKAEAVRLTLVLTLTHAASYRITQPEPDRLVVDLERANFDLEHPIDLKTQGGWITDWAYGYLMFGYTRVSLHFDRKVTVTRDEMKTETTSSPAELTIDLVEAA